MSLDESSVFDFSFDGLGGWYDGISSCGDFGITGLPGSDWDFSDVSGDDGLGGWYEGISSCGDFGITGLPGSDCDFLDVSGDDGLGCW